MRPSAEQVEAAILDALTPAAGRPRLATYVLKNSLRRRGLDVDSRVVLRACRRLERRGRIRSAPTNYVVMLEWTLAA